MDERARLVLDEARAGRVDHAIARGEAMLADGLQDAGLALFVGMLCCRQGDVSRGVHHLRRAAALAPAELTPRIELARALLLIDDADGAAQLAAPLASVETLTGREMQRIQAHALTKLGRVAEAQQRYQQLVDVGADDFESLAGLGSVLLQRGAIPDAINALRRATVLKPTVGNWVTLARAHLAASDFAAAADVAQQALRTDPDEANAYLVSAAAAKGLRQRQEAAAYASKAAKLAGSRTLILVEAAEIQAGSQAFVEAETTYRLALKMAPGLATAWFGLGTLYARMNRFAELTQLLADANDTGIPAATLGLLRAKYLRREGRLAEAMAAAQDSAVDVAPAARAQMIGELADRLDDTELAFEAFSNAGSILAANATHVAFDPDAYRRTLETLGNLLTPEWHRAWSPSPAPSGRRSPLFIFGFPRSGTTLLDTMLTGHPDVVVLEEEAVIEEMAEALGPVERIPSLSQREIMDLRNLYYAKVDRLIPDVASRLIVDKNPLGLSSTPLLVRLFPDARFVFAERHPCDVVLSCFMNSFEFNMTMAKFFDLEDTAKLYDRVFRYWTRCCSVLPFARHFVRYERLIASPERELRPVAAFAGLDWHEGLLATEANAVRRTYIASPSYAQVGEPIYTRACGRWLRYKDRFADTLPILQPWINAMGYSSV